MRLIEGRTSRPAFALYGGVSSDCGPPLVFDLWVAVETLAGNTWADAGAQLEVRRRQLEYAGRTTDRR